ncbi:MAG: hypothetical protein ABEI80_08025 [Haloplanus sp.]
MSRGDGIPPDALPASTLHVTESKTAVSAKQCARITPHSAASNVIVVAFATSPVRWIDQWHDSADDAPERVTVVVSERASWAAGHPRDRLEPALPSDTDVRVETVGSPDNFTDLGVTLTETLESYEERDDPPILCFQSLTLLLEYAALDQVCQFLHTLVGHIDQFGAAGHFHLHEHAHEERTVEKLRGLFDRVRNDPT